MAVAWVAERRTRNVPELSALYNTRWVCACCKTSDDVTVLGLRLRLRDAATATAHPRPAAAVVATGTHRRPCKTIAPLHMTRWRTARMRATSSAAAVAEWHQWQQWWRAWPGALGAVFAVEVYAVAPHKRSGQRPYAAASSQQQPAAAARRAPLIWSTLFGAQGSILRIHPPGSPGFRANGVGLLCTQSACTHTLNTVRMFVLHSSACVRACGSIWPAASR